MAAGVDPGELAAFGTAEGALKRIIAPFAPIVLLERAGSRDHDAVRW
jgi:hypothetical protein